MSTGLAQLLGPRPVGTLASHSPASGEDESACWLQRCEGFAGRLPPGLEVDGGRLLRLLLLLLMLLVLLMPLRICLLMDI